MTQDSPDSLEQARLALAYAVETRRFEIERFWQRSLIFWGIIAAALVAFGTLGKDPGQDLVRLQIGCFGLVASLAWTLQSRGGKYWQESWEAKVERIEVEVLGRSLFGDREQPDDKGLLGAATYSVSKIAIALGYVAIMTWLGLIAPLIPLTLEGCGVHWDRVATLFATAIACSVLVIGCRTSAKRSHA